MNSEAPAPLLADRSPFRPAPDIRVCVARAIGDTGYADCLANAASGCKHAMLFGYGYFCRHPQLKEVIEQAQQRARQ